MRKSRAAIALGILAATAAAYWYWPAERAVPIPGIVRSTEIRIAPEIGGRLAAFRVRSGDAVHRGDVLAELNSPELVAALFEARAAVGEARATRDRVYAGMRQEEVDVLAREVEKAEANVLLAEQQHSRVATHAANDHASKQDLDKATAELGAAAATLAAARLRHAEAKAGPTREELAAADATLGEAEAAAAVLQRRLEKTVLSAPIDGIVRVIVAEPGEAVRPGQPVLTLDAGRERWFAFNVREDQLSGLTVGTALDLRAGPDRTIAARVTEIRGLGDFATWRAARAVGDHDLNTFLVRADPVRDLEHLEAGMTVWLSAP